MKNKKILFMLIFPFLLFGCGEKLKFDSNSFNKNPLIGTWKGLTANGTYEHIIFKENGSIEILDEEMTNPYSGKGISLSYEAINEVTPHQLYITMKFQGKSERIPLGIYKIKNEKMVLREPIEYHKSIGGFDLGVSRYEMPKDFSGIIKTYEKIK